MNIPVMIGLVVLVVILLLPLVFKKKPYPLVGPDISELQYIEVFFENGPITLSGMLFLPNGNGPFPAVVMIHGSGTSKRNSPWYLSVTKHLQGNGIAVLLPDKRGSEKSGGDWKKATFHDLAADAIAAIRYIQSQKTFAYSQIGVMGFSQGGWIAPVAVVEATESELISFVVSMSGPGVTTDEQLLYEETNNLAGYGTYHFIARLIAPIAVKVIKKKDWWGMIGGFDPLPYWSKVNIPVFMAFGEKDKNVPVAESVRKIKALNKQNITTKIYPQLGHGLADPVTHRIQETYLHDLVEFIGQITG
jgi:dipeptidyl aminopeptidase/acylaminoacyl peptidase